MNMLYEALEPVKNSFIPLHEPKFSFTEIEYVSKCVESTWVSSIGKNVEVFEEEISKYTGIKYAVGVVNGTSALHLALLTLSIKPDEEVIVPALTFISSANSVRYVGAFPVFVDVDEQTGCISPSALQDFLRNQCCLKNGQLINKVTHRKVRAIMPVDLLGHPCEMNLISKIAQEYNLFLIQDSAESFGARYMGKHVGYHADWTCLSFNGNKILTCGTGGMLLTHDEALAKKARYLSTQAKDDSTYYIHHEIGFNYRFSNLHASIGLAQLASFSKILKHKRKIASFYEKSLSLIPGIALPQEKEECLTNFWLYTPRFDKKVFGMSNFTLRSFLEKRNIGARLLWQPMHRSRAHKESYSHNINVADRIYTTALSLPSSWHITNNQLTYIIDSIAEASKAIDYSR